MNSYIISGADKTTGVDVRMELEAASEAEARSAAIKQGVLITECKIVGDELPPGNRTESYLREIALWLRFFGIATALGIFAVVLKLVMSK
jgi:hypothetical protein